jgi:hypothetical protein
MREDFDPVLADRFKVLDDVAVPDTWTRTQSKVLNHVPVQFTEEDAAMIDLQTPSQIDERRKGPKRVAAAVLLAAAAVVAIALVVIRNDDPVSPANQPSPTVTVPATVAPRALFGTQDEQFAPGTYYVDEVDGTATPRIFVTLGDGWEELIDGWSIGKDVAGVMTFSRPDRVFSDACHPDDGLHPGPMTTLDGLVAALSEQAGWALITSPSDITVNGYQGKTFRRTAPSTFAGCNHSFASFPSWENGPEGGSDDELGWSYYEPDEIETLNVLDVNGTIVIINTRLKPEHQDAAAVAELSALLDSIRIEQA